MIESGHIRLDSLASEHDADDSDSEDAERSNHENPDHTCAICLGDYRNRQPFKLSCGHTYCSGCIHTEFQRSIQDGEQSGASTACPLCRKEVSSAEVSVVRRSQGVVKQFLEDLPADSGAKWFCFSLSHHNRSGRRRGSHGSSFSNFTRSFLALSAALLS